MSLKRYEPDFAFNVENGYDGMYEKENGKFVKFSDVEHLVAEIKRLQQCCKDFQFVLEGSRAIKQSEQMLDKRDTALMRALGWDDSKILSKIGMGE